MHDIEPNPGPSLRVAQWNAAGLTAEKRISFLRLLPDVDVVLLQELKMTEREAAAFSLAGFQCVMKARNQHGGGVGIIVRDCIPVTKRLDYRDDRVEMVSADVVLGEHIATLTSAYFPRGRNVTPEALARLADTLPSSIIGMDANAHHPEWDPRLSSDAAGDAVVEFATDYGYTIMNDGAPTRMSPHGSASTPDVTLARGTICRDWVAVPSPDSDHFLITVTALVGDCATATLGVSTSSNKGHYSWQKANWQKFRSDIKKASRNFPSTGTADQMAKSLENIVRTACARNVPRGWFKSKELWTPELEHLDHMCRQLLEKQVACANSVHPATLQHQLTLRKKLLRELRNSAWASTCQEMDPAQRATWSIFKRIVTPKPLALQAVIKDGEAVSLRQQANALVSFFAKKSRRHKDSTVPPPVNIHPRATVAPITPQELKKAFASLQNGAAAGPDDIYNDALKQMGRHGNRLILRLFNKSLHSGRVPASWRTGEIVPILKPNKDAAKLESYRPITLTSSIGKLMERVLAARLQPVVDSCQNQFGFRSGMSTTDTLLWYRARTTPKTKGGHAAVLVDFSRAFDSIDHRKLLEVLDSFEEDKLSQFTKRWIRNWLHDRTAKVRTGHKTRSRREKFTCGVPQGSVLGPLLFIIVMNTLSNQLSAASIPHAFYADDLTLVASGPDLELTLQRGLNIIEAWTSEFFMDVNDSKTKYTMVARRKPLTLRYKGTVIGHDAHPTLLGIALHNVDHVSKLQRTSVLPLLKLAAVSHNTHGCNKTMLRCFHIAALESTLLYACPAWYGSLSFTHQDELDALQARGTRKIAGLPTGSKPIDAALEADITPIALRAKTLTYAYFVKCLLRGGTLAATAQDAFPPSSDIGKLHDRVVRDLGPIEPLDYHCPTLDHRIIISQTTVPQLDATAPAAQRKEASEASLRRRCIPNIEIWTDGSVKALDASGGAAMVYAAQQPPWTILKRGSSAACSFRAEAIAIAAGLSFMTSDDGPRTNNKRIALITDSQSNLAAFNNRARRSMPWSLTQGQAIRALNALRSGGHKIKLCFVFSHCGIERNELVDRAADAATSIPDPPAPVWWVDALTYARSLLREDFYANNPRAESQRKIAIDTLATKKTSENRLLATLGAQLRCNWSTHFGSLYRILHPQCPSSCRWCSTHPLPKTLDPVTPATKRARARDPVICNICAVPVGNRNTARVHLVRNHDFSLDDAIKESFRLQFAPHYNPVANNCPHCPATAPPIAARKLPHHVATRHPDQMLKRPRPPPEPPPAAHLPAPAPQQQHLCPICNQQYKSVNGVAVHMAIVHKMRQIRPRLHRPPCEESAIHILQDCPALEGLRLAYGYSPPADIADWWREENARFLIRALQLLPSLGYPAALPDILTFTPAQAGITGSPERKRSNIQAAITTPLRPSPRAPGVAHEDARARGASSFDSTPPPPAAFSWPGTPSPPSPFSWKTSSESDLEEADAAGQ